MPRDADPIFREVKIKVLNTYYFSESFRKMMLGDDYIPIEELNRIREERQRKIDERNNQL